jgi:hypothetical protein
MVLKGTSFSLSLEEAILLHSYFVPMPKLNFYILTYHTNIEGLAIMNSKNPCQNNLEIDLNN